MYQLNPLFLCQIAVTFGCFGWLAYFLVFLPFAYLATFGSQL